MKLIKKEKILKASKTIILLKFLRIIDAFLISQQV